MKIQVLSVNVNHIPNAKGGYDVAEVAYKDLAQGKVGGKKIMSFLDKAVFNAAKAMKANGFYEITMAKEAGNDGKEYWQWKNIAEADGEAPAPAAGKAGFTPPKSNYETPEERVARQRLIVRQSSLSNAVTLLKTEKTTPATQDVLTLADLLCDWVYEVVEAPVQGGDDIPF